MTMTPSSQAIDCPWCTLQTTDGDTFRTHLMVEHRKSELSTFVLEAIQTAELPERVVPPASEDERTDEESNGEPELLAQ